MTDLSPILRAKIARPGTQTTGHKTTAAQKNIVFNLHGVPILLHAPSVEAIRSSTLESRNSERKNTLLEKAVLLRKLGNRAIMLRAEIDAETGYLPRSAKNPKPREIDDRTIRTLLSERPRRISMLLHVAASLGIFQHPDPYAEDT